MSIFPLFSPGWQIDSRGEWSIKGGREGGGKERDAGVRRLQGSVTLTLSWCGENRKETQTKTMAQRLQGSVTLTLWKQERDKNNGKTVWDVGSKISLWSRLLMRQSKMGKRHCPGSIGSWAQSLCVVETRTGKRQKQRRWLKNFPVVMFVDETG